MTVWANFKAWLSDTDPAPWRGALNPRPQRFSNDDYQKAALDLVYPKIGGVSTCSSKDDSEKRRALICDLRKNWAMTVHDVRLRNHVFSWLNFYEKHSYDETFYRENVKRRMDDYDRRYADKQKRADALLDHLSVSRE